MDDSLQRESEKLARSWARHDSNWLRDYLVSGVEDPRLNLQSVLSRHFLIRAVTGDRFATLMTEECRFAAVLNWLADFSSRAGDPEAFSVLLYALRRGADNAEGSEIPHFVRNTFARLPVTCDPLTVPNYVEAFLATTFSNGAPEFSEPTLSCFQQLWLTTFSSLLSVPSRTHHVSRITLPAVRTPHSAVPTLLEPACGSANDYRFLHSFGIARFFDYAGFDLSDQNIQNARSLFPEHPVDKSATPQQSRPDPRNSSHPRFEVANVFEIPAPDKSYDLCLVHDLFEHLSLPGLELAVKEVCRVTRNSACIGFFQMDEIPDHIARPVDDYHINLLSVDRTKSLFARGGFSAQVIHIATFLRSQFGCHYTHNPNAYTFLLEAC